MIKPVGRSVSLALSVAMCLGCNAITGAADVQLVGGEQDEADQDGASGSGAGNSTGSGSGAGTSEGGGPVEGSGLDVLGNNQHGPDAVDMVEIAGGADFAEPRDLAFNPDTPGQLWIVNRADHSVTVLDDAGGPSQQVDNIWSSDGAHFLAEPSSLAFGLSGRFATIHETDAPTQGNATPADFMGPTLWTSNRSQFDAGHSGHFDMLHNSPNGMGLAWEQANVYWVFDGYHSALTRYDFVGDHGGGGSDHSDGDIARFVEGEVQRVADVPSHMEIAGNLLYVADTGNSRVAVLDITSGTKGSSISPNLDGVSLYAMNGASLTTLVDGAALGMEQPSGLAIAGDVLFVTDNASSTIYGFSLSDGEVLDWLDTGLPPGSLMGIEVGAAGELYIVDAPGNRVLRIAPK